MAKTVYQGHHPSRILFPNYTIKLRQWIHMFVRRLEQFSPTDSNIEELRATEEAVSWIRRLKELELKGHIDNGKGQAEG